MPARYLLLCAALLLGGCATSPLPPGPPAALWRDQQFRPPASPVTTEHIFAVSDAMRRYLHAQVVAGQPGKDLRRALFDALYRKDKLRLDYDAEVTRDAQQAFTARSGNCLSLVIMTAALARELGIGVQYQRIVTEDSWSRSGQLYFSSNHVNLVLGDPQLQTGRGYSSQPYLTVDFLPVPEHERQQAQALEQHTIVAMYLNNRAAELLAQEQLDEAYWHARKALEADPAYTITYNTLGVIYKHHGDLGAAEQVLRHALAREPDNTIYLYNLAQTLDELQRPQEAAVVRDRLAQLEPYPPFHFFHLGQAAMQRGDYARARQLFQRELARAPDYHEFHYWLAQADFQLGQLQEADRHMKLALENSTTRSDHALYSAKLDRIRALEQHGLPPPRQQ